MNFGSTDRGAGDADALTAAAVQLMGIGEGKPAGKADGIHKLRYTALPLVFILADAHGLHRLRNQVRHAHAGIKARIGILEDHLDLLMHGFFLRAIGMGHILPLEAQHARSGFMQTHDRPTQSGFAAAGLAHDAEGGLFLNGKGQVLHGMELTTRGLEVFAKMLDLNDGCHGFVTSSNCSAARRHFTKCPGVISKWAGFSCRQASCA